MGGWRDTFCGNFFELIHIVQDIAYLVGKHIDVIIGQIDTGQIGHINDIFLGDFHGCFS